MTSKKLLPKKIPNLNRVRLNISRGTQIVYNNVWNLFNTKKKKNCHQEKIENELENTLYLLKKKTTTIRNMGKNRYFPKSFYNTLNKMVVISYLLNTLPPTSHPITFIFHTFNNKNTRFFPPLDLGFLFAFMLYILHKKNVK